MTTTTKVPSGFIGRIGGAGVGVPLLILARLAMVVLPLPPLVLDVLFTFNIALSLIVMLAVVYVMRPLEFAIFPTVLLLATLLPFCINRIPGSQFTVNKAQGRESSKLKRCCGIF